MISKYLFNQLLTVATSVVFISLFVWLATTNSINFAQSTLVFGLLIICEHYLLNLVHIASHKGISKHLFINDLYGNFAAILSGVTLPVFRTTHNLHHAFPNDPEKDPDFTISNSGSVWLIASRIFYHDYFFFKKRLFKPKGYLLTYFIDRAAQISLVLVFVFVGSLNAWTLFWLPSMLFIGTLYGFFQFYFPHYSTKLIDSWRVAKKPNVFQKSMLFWIDFSFYYHFKHHQKVNSNRHYFPLWCYFQDRFIYGKSLTESLKEVNY
jgi:beta-carotene hydroxylase